jgi:hypothetical protein
MKGQHSSSADSASTDTSISVPSDLHGCHPLISQTRKALKQEKPDERGILRSTQNGILNVTVSRTSLHRALRIMQAVLTAAESRDWSFITRKEEASCAIKIGDDEMGVRISERVKRFEIPREKPPQGWYFKQYRYEATGILYLDITDYVAEARRHEWSDGKRRQLEEILPEFIDGLAAAAEARRKWHLELADRDRQWKEAETRQQELEQRKRTELGRRERLLKQAEQYSEAASVRNLITDFRSSKNLPEFWTDEARTRWARWAERIADKLNPFQNGYFSEKLAKTDFEAELDCR